MDVAWGGKRLRVWGPYALTIVILLTSTASLAYMQRRHDLNTASTEGRLDRVDERLGTLTAAIGTLTESLSRHAEAEERELREMKSASEAVRVNLFLICRAMTRAECLK